MHIACDCNELYQILLSAFEDCKVIEVDSDGHKRFEIDKFGGHNRILQKMTECCLHELCIKISTIAFREEQSIHIRRLVENARNSVEIFRADVQSKLQDVLNSFDLQLDDIKNETTKIKEIRDKLLAHLDRKTIQNESAIIEAFRSLNLDWDIFSEMVNRILAVHRQVLNYFNDAMPNDQKILFQVEEAHEFRKMGDSLWASISKDLA